MRSWTGEGGGSVPGHVEEGGFLSGIRFSTKAKA